MSFWSHGHQRGGKKFSSKWNQVSFFEGDLKVCWVFIVNYCGHMFALSRVRFFLPPTPGSDLFSFSGEVVFFTTPGCKVLWSADAERRPFENCPHKVACEFVHACVRVCFLQRKPDTNLLEGQRLSRLAKREAPFQCRDSCLLAAMQCVPSTSDDLLRHRNMYKSDVILRERTRSVLTKVCEKEKAKTDCNHKSNCSGWRVNAKIWKCEWTEVKGVMVLSPWLLRLAPLMSFEVWKPNTVIRLCALHEASLSENEVKNVRKGEHFLTRCRTISCVFRFQSVGWKFAPCVRRFVLVAKARSKILQIFVWWVFAAIGVTKGFISAVLHHNGHLAVDRAPGEPTLHLSVATRHRSL